MQCYFLWQQNTLWVPLPSFYWRNVFLPSVILSFSNASSAYYIPVGGREILRLCLPYLESFIPSYYQQELKPFTLVTTAWIRDVQLFIGLCRVFLAPNLVTVNMKGFSSPLIQQFSINKYKHVLLVLFHFLENRKSVISKLISLHNKEIVLQSPSS